MKVTWLNFSISAALLSGCSSMLFDNNMAPVSNQNYYGENSQIVEQNTKSTPQIQPFKQIQSVNKNMAPSVKIAPPYKDDNNSTQVNSLSPYLNAPATAIRPNINTNDSWNTSPNTVNNQQNTVKPVETNNSPQSTQPVVQPNPTQQEEATTTVKNENTSVASATPPTTNTSKTGSAVQSLLKQAAASLGQGKLDNAAAYLEDANRIEPKNVKILYDIANIRYHQGKYREAESFAGRAVQVGGSTAVMKKSWSLIANARKALGDNQGAIIAAEKAASFSN